MKPKIMSHQYSCLLIQLSAIAARPGNTGYFSDLGKVNLSPHRRLELLTTIGGSNPEAASIIETIKNTPVLEDSAI
jgi:hypothetical protein